jgi:hypothetical protein
MQRNDADGAVKLGRTNWSSWTWIGWHERLLGTEGAETRKLTEVQGKVNGTAPTGVNEGPGSHGGGAERRGRYGGRGATKKEGNLYHG